MPTDSPRSIVIIDDNLAVLQVIRTLLSDIVEGKRVDCFVSNNGVEGLGYILATEPDIIIIDTTLPKYSGREVLDFLASNQKFHKKGVTVIILHEGAHVPNGLPDNFIVLSKTSSEFVPALFRQLASTLETNLPHLRMKLWLGKQIVGSANRGDLLLHGSDGSNIINRSVSLFLWFITQVFTGIYLFVLTLLGQQLPVQNISIRKGHRGNLRVPVYPTLVTVIVAFLVLIVQVGLFVTGGIIVFNTRIVSVFALSQTEVAFTFGNGNTEIYDYPVRFVDFSSSGVQLKQQPIETITLQEYVPYSASGESNMEQSEPGRVLGQPTAIFQAIYPTNAPAVAITQPISYSRLISFIEESNLNNASSSLAAPNINQQAKSIGITYQLSPDGNSWYFYSYGDSQWKKTNQGGVNSNSVQEVNQNLASLQEIFNTGQVYVRVFLHSEGQITPILEKITIDRELDLVTEVTPS